MQIEIVSADRRDGKRSCLIQFSSERAIGYHDFQNQVNGLRVRVLFGKNAEPISIRYKNLNRTPGVQIPSGIKGAKFYQEIIGKAHSLAQFLILLGDQEDHGHLVQQGAEILADMVGHDERSLDLPDKDLPDKVAEVVQKIGEAVPKEAEPCGSSS